MKTQQKAIGERPTLNPALKEFWLTKARNKVLYGGRVSSKSWDAAGMAVFLANRYQLRFLCARQIQNKIEQSVYTLLKTQIARFGLQANFDIQNNKIVNTVTGSEFVFYGLWRNIDDIKSLEGIDICWIEEAHGLTKAQWEILEPTVRKDHSEFWIIFNPDLVTDFVYKHFVLGTPPDTIKRLINYPENPFLSDTILKVINAKKEEDIDDFNHVYLGEPRQDDNLAIIKRSWVTAAIDAHVKLGFKATGAKTIGYDVADSGEDKNATAYTHGSVIRSVDEWSGGEDELLKSSTRAYDEAQAVGASIVYDSIGVGASAGAKFKELNASHVNLPNIDYSKFNAGDSVSRPDRKYQDTKVTNKDMFANLKAQAWWDLAQRFKNTYNAIHRGQEFDPDDLISISSMIDEATLEQLKNELSTPRQDRDRSGKVKVESKIDLKKRGIVSPNLADAVVMACSEHLLRSKFSYKNL